MAKDETDRSLQNRESANKSEPKHKVEDRPRSSMKMNGNCKEKKRGSENHERPKSVVTFEPRVQIVKEYAPQKNPQK